MFTEVAFVLLVVAYSARAIAFREEVRQALRDPATAMGYFTLIAGTNVLAIRLLMAGHPLVTLVLGALASVLWAVLSYGLPWSIIVAAQRPVLGDINGTWLIWVVATQSVAVVADGLAASSPWRSLRDGLPAVAVAFWGVGIMLYVILIVIIFLRLFFVEISAKEMGPAYWIAMGATAISVRAAAGILAIKDHSAAALLARHAPGAGRPLGHPVGVRHLVDPAPRTVRSLALRAASLSEGLRAEAVERRVSSRHVHGCLGHPRSDLRARVHDVDRQGLAVGRRGRLARHLRPTSRFVRMVPPS